MPIFAKKIIELPSNTLEWKIEEIIKRFWFCGLAVNRDVYTITLIGSDKAIRDARELIQELESLAEFSERDETSEADFG